MSHSVITAKTNIDIPKTVPKYYNQINDKVLYFSLLNLTIKQMDLNSQSIDIAIHTPSTPRLVKLTSTILKPILQVNIDTIEIIIVNLTSLAARKALGKAKDVGQIRAARVQ